MVKPTRGGRRQNISAERKLNQSYTKGGKCRIVYLKELWNGYKEVIMTRDPNSYPYEYDGYKIPKGITKETEETKRMQKAAEKEMEELIASIKAQQNK